MYCVLVVKLDWYVFWNWGVVAVFVAVLNCEFEFVLD